MNTWGEIGSRGHFHGKLTDVEGKTLTLLPVQRITSGIASMAANEVIHKRVMPGLRFIIKRRDGRYKQIEEWSVTSVTDREVYCQRHIKDRYQGKDTTLYLGTARMSFGKLREGMAKGRIKVVVYPNVRDYAPDALIEMLVVAEEEKRRKKVKAVRSGFEGWRPMRRESNRDRRLRLHQPRRVHFKKHEFYDPFYGQAKKKVD